MDASDQDSSSILASSILRDAFFSKEGIDTPYKKLMIDIRTPYII